MEVESVSMEDERRLTQLRFDAAVKVIKSLPPDGPFQPSNDMMLKFYSYYKQATVGACNIPRPGFWDAVGKAKWDAWNSLGDMSKEEAMAAYVDEMKLILEGMPMTGEVEELLRVLGPFYELIEEKKKITEISDLSTGFGTMMNSVTSKSVTKSIIRTMEMNGTLETCPAKLKSKEGMGRSEEEEQEEGEMGEEEEEEEEEEDVIREVRKDKKSASQPKKKGSGRRHKAPLSNGKVANGVTHLNNGSHSRAALNSEDSQEGSVGEPQLNGHHKDPNVDVSGLIHLTSDSDSEVYCDSVDQFGQEESSEHNRSLDDLDEEENHVLPPIEEPHAMQKLQGDVDGPPQVVRCGGEDGDNGGKISQRPRVNANMPDSSLARRGRGSRSPGFGSGSRLPSYGGGDGDGGRRGGAATPEGNLNEQIVMVLARLQEDMQSVLERLHTLEALTASQARSLSLSPTYPSPQVNNRSQPLCSAFLLCDLTTPPPPPPPLTYSHHSCDNIETEAATEDELVSKRKSNGSIIWRWFGFKVSDDQQKNVFCKECRKTVATKGSSTTNLFHHLQQHHKVQYEECVRLRAATQTTKPSQPAAPKQTLLQASLTHAVPYERTSDPNKVVREYEQEVIIVPTLLFVATLATLLALLIMRYCPERKQTRTTTPQRYHSSSHRHTQRHSHRHQLQGIDAPPGINPLEHEELPMTVQQVHHNVKPTLAAVPQISTERHPGAFSQVSALPLFFSIKPNDTVSLYRARMNNRDVILRVLKETANSREKQHFLGFASFVSGLGPHPFLPELLGVVSVQLPIMMVVEELQHRDLLGFLWRCRQDHLSEESTCDMTEKRIFTMAGQVASALDYLHSRGCIHGNLGARSVLVGRDLTAKLWGLGSAYRRRTQVDSPGEVEDMEMRKWQAPEVLSRRAISQSSDVWSFGILLYEMVTLGDPPFAQLLATELLQHLQRGNHLSRPASCSNTLYSIIKSCCHFNPQQRLSVSELIRKLQAGEKSANGRTVLRVPEPLDIEKYMREAGYGEAYNYAVL